MGFEVGICASENEKIPGGQAEGQKYSSSCSTTVRPWQAERTAGARAWVRKTCRNCSRICHSQTDSLQFKVTNIFFMRMVLYLLETTQPECRKKEQLVKIYGFARIVCPRRE